MKKLVLCKQSSPRFIILLDYYIAYCVFVDLNITLPVKKNEH